MTALGIPWDRVHEEAERLEHVISEDLEDRIDALLYQTFGGSLAFAGL